MLNKQSLKKPLKKLSLYISVFLFTLVFGYTNAYAKNNSKATYRVYGKHYQVMHTSKNYSAQGIASWYGRAFQNKPTSSGERYNMYSLTAAHKSLPLRTYVQVTNLINGKKVVVKVNDRGPFVGNRLIDLSYAAAQKLGMVGRGLAPVSIKALS